MKTPYFDERELNVWMKKHKKMIVPTVLAFVSLAILVWLARCIIVNVDANEYHIKQALGTGQLSAKMRPGWYMANFGKVFTFPKSETVYFSINTTKDDWSIPVIFSDNSKCNISGSTRITMPVTEQDAINILAKYSNRSFKDFEVKNIMPLIRRSLIVAASTMTAPEGKKRMNEIATMGQDQVNNGIYMLQDITTKDVDIVSGETITKITKRIKYNEQGMPVRFTDDIPLQSFGADAKNFVVSEINCNTEIENQITEQQKAQMDITTSKAKAAKAEQDKITIEKQGEANIAKIKAEEEAKSQQQLVQADRDKKMAIIEAQKRVEVAKQQMAEEKALFEAAELQARTIKVLADADAYKAKSAVTADNYAKEKLEAWKFVMEKNADAIGKMRLPNYLVINGGDSGTTTGNTGGAAMSVEMSNFMNMLMLKAARDLDVDPRPVANSK